MLQSDLEKSDLELFQSEEHVYMYLKSLIGRCLHFVQRSYGKIKTD